MKMFGYAKKPRSLKSHITFVVMRWSVIATLTSLICAIPFLIHLVIESADRQMEIVSKTAVQAFKPMILSSGDIKQTEKEMRTLFHLREDESMTVLDPKFMPIYIRDKDASITTEGRQLICNGKPGFCWNPAHTYLSALVPIYFDSEDKELFGYLAIRLKAPVDVLLIIGLVLMVLSLQLFSAGGIVLKLGNLAGEVSKNLEDWAKILKTSPKTKFEGRSAPYLELTEMQEAVSGLHLEIERLEKHAGSQAQFTLIRGISHDIVGPILRLSKMVSILERTENLAMDPNERVEILAKIQIESRRLSGLANEVKFLREISSRNKSNRTPTCSDLRKELSALTSDLSKDDEVTAAQLKIQFAAPMVPVPARISSSECYRVFSNLIRNAVQASAPGGEIAVKIFLENNNPTVIVSDKGHGMSPEIKSRIFDLDFTTKSKTGTGLGLPVVKYICDFNDITISVTSTPGVGSSFKLKFVPPIDVPTEIESNVKHITAVAQA